MNSPALSTSLRALCTSSSLFGHMFVGTQLQLQAEGFGVGYDFSGITTRAKKLSATEIYARVFIEALRPNEYCSPQTPGHSPLYRVQAFFLDLDTFVGWPSSDLGGGIVLRKLTYVDEYVGLARDMVLTGLITESMLPGQSGCGKSSTTFDCDGKVIAKPHKWTTAGFKCVSKVGRKIQLTIGIHADEAERRKDLMRHAQTELDNFYRNEVERKFSTQIVQTTAQRPALRLVWSA